MFKFFTSDLRRNIIKILCLSIGLSIGLLLVARVYFDKSYDTFFKDSDRIYRLYETAERDGEFERFPTTPGGYAPLFQKDFPQVEISTRFLHRSDKITLCFEDGRKISTGDLCWTDENIFELFNISILVGDPQTVLLTEGQCFIPRSLATKIGGDVIGTPFTMPTRFPDKKFTIGGIYEDIPLNSSIPNAVYFSMSSNPDETRWKDNYNGNDLYSSFIRLIPGATLQDIEPGIKKIVEENIPKEYRDSMKLNIIIDKLTNFYVTQKDITTMDWMLMLLAIILLLGSSLNFLLIVIGQVDKRGKEMAVRKCYGTSDFKIFGRVIRESLFYLVVSAFIGILTVFCFPSLCDRLLGYTPDQFFTTGNVWIVVLVVCLVLLILTGVIPAWIYCRTPVASAFRGNVKGRRGWKMALLSIQFFSAAVLICLLVLVARQYKMAVKLEKGFDVDNIAWVFLPIETISQRSSLVSEFQNLSFVNDVSSSTLLIGGFGSGNNVWMNGNVANMVNISDNYSTNANFFDLMGIEFIQGETFSANADSTINQVVVEKAFIDVVKKLTGEDSDYIVGKSFQITEHGSAYYTICGVINDIRRGNLNNVDNRAGVWFPSSKPRRCIVVKLDEITPEKLKILQEIIDNKFPDKEHDITTLKDTIEGQFAPIRNFATSVMIAGVAILVIALIGLIGYTGDEVQRRSKEIAIRKVSGTSARQIISLFLRNTLVIAIPSMIVGGAVAMIAGRKWLSQFAEQVPISPLSMILCLVVLLLIISSVTVYNTLGVASSNPVNHLRNE
ncbi:MAG: ABC transporter permease [Muribaculaceae bacterium]|nr:ABC transporter permease [Muribaculaceae bacterium]